jgi:hypothetical protein
MKLRKGASKPPTQLILDNIRFFGKDSLQIKRKKRVFPRKNKSRRGKFRSNSKRKRRNKKNRK